MEKDDKFNSLIFQLHHYDIDIQDSEDEIDDDDRHRIHQYPIAQPKK